MPVPTASDSSAEDESPLLALATRIASDQHAGQKDKAGEPYLGHPLRVAGKLDDEAGQAVALLHDVLEDGKLTDDALRGLLEEASDPGTAAEVASAVQALTHPKHEPLDVYYRRVRSNPLAFRVKLADVHDSLEPARLSRLSPQKRDYFLGKYGRALTELSVGHDAPPV
jgi:hypothetical protein